MSCTKDIYMMPTNKHHRLSRKNKKKALFLATIAIALLLIFTTIKIPKKTENFDPSITFCIVPYPVTNTKLMELYLLTMGSWLETSNNAELLILLPEKTFDPNFQILPILYERFGKNRIHFTKEIEYDENGVPYIDDWFLKGFDFSKTDYVCWINADIIIPIHWYPRVKFIVNYFKLKNKQVGIISRRCDFEYHSDYNLSVDWPIDFDKISERRKTHSKWGVDFYLISKNPMQLNIDEIPPFHMGKYRWDPWTTGWLNQNLELVSLGDEFCTYHVNHVPKSRDMSDPKVKENFEMAARAGRFNAANHLTKYHLKKSKLMKDDILILKSPIEFISNAPLNTEKV